MLTNVKVIEKCTCSWCGCEINSGYICRACEFQERNEQANREAYREIYGDDEEYEDYDEEEDDWDDE